MPIGLESAQRIDVSAGNYYIRAWALWVFSRKYLWVIGYHRVMGYDSDAPANQLGGQEKLWVTVEYGLPQVWVRTESTVIQNATLH